MAIFDNAKFLCLQNVAHLVFLDHFGIWGVKLGQMGRSNLYIPVLQRMLST